MVTAKQIIDKASEYIGIVESPPNSNKVMFNDWFYGKSVSGSAYPWCQSYISKVFYDCNALNLITKTASTETMAKWFKDRNQMYYKDPKPGDICFMNFGNKSRFTTHVGIVKEVTEEGVVNIEGNTSVTNDINGGSVMLRTRKFKDIVGFGRPAYDAEDTLKKYIDTPTTLSYPSIGVDVSSYQKNINYLLLRQNGVKYAILKIIRKDGNVDTMFETHYKGFIDVGVPIMAVYNYSYATSVEQAEKDAKKVLDILAGRQIPVCLDVEDQTQKNLGHKLADIINAYQAVIESAGLDFLLYTGMSFYNTYIRPYRQDLNCKNYWIARYYAGSERFNGTTMPNEKSKPDIGEDIIGWQYSSSGKITGYSGRLDMNVWYRDIHSDETKAIVIANKLNIRSTPQTGEILGVYKKGERVTVLETDQATGWLKTPRGYISNAYVQIG